MNAPSRRAPSLATRNLCIVAALLPGVLLQWRDDHALPLRLVLALVAALAFEALSLKLRRQPMAYLREGSASVYALLLVSWLPSLDGIALLCTLFVALVLARQAFGGLGRNLFHPVAAGVAFAQLAAFTTPTAAFGEGDWLPFAWLLGGLALLPLRIWRWQVPVFLLGGAIAGSLVSGTWIELLLDPAWMLAAFFVAGDPVTTPEDPRARAVAAMAAGLVAGVFGIAVLPFALLAMNAASPLLDAGFDRVRAQAQRA